MIAVPDQSLGEEMSEDAGGSITGTRPPLSVPLASGDQEPRGDEEEEGGETGLHHPSFPLPAAA